VVSPISGTDGNHGAGETGEAHGLPLDRHPRFRRLYDYLRGKAPPGRLCGRQHIDPAEITELLPHLILVDIVRDPGRETRFRFRLVGSKVAAQHGYDFTGMFVEDAIPERERAQQILATYHGVLADRLPNYLRGGIASPSRKFLPVERVVFPLARDGETIDMLIGVFIYPLEDKVN
jgi:hypothetical protein